MQALSCRIREVYILAPREPVQPLVNHELFTSTTTDYRHTSLLQLCPTHLAIFPKGRGTYGKEVFYYPALSLLVCCLVEESKCCFRGLQAYGSRVVQIKDFSFLLLKQTKHEVTFTVSLSKYKYTWCFVLSSLVTHKEPRTFLPGPCFPRGNGATPWRSLHPCFPRSNGGMPWCSLHRYFSTEVMGTLCGIIFTFLF